ncbi:hypothetical protein D9M68_620340 [compost metagenome]
MVHAQAGVEALHVVGVDRRLHVGPPELAAAVVVVGQGGGPAVFVEVEHALGVDMPGARLELGLYHPDAVFLVAHVFGVDVPSAGEQLFVAYAGVVDLVVVVRDVHLFLADDCPVVAVSRAVEQAVLVVHAEAAGAGGRVVANGGGAAHAALSGRVLPGLAGLGDGVDVLVADDDLAFLADRFEAGQQEVREDPFGVAEVMVGRRPDRIDLVVDLLEHLVAVGVVDRLHVGGFLGGGAALHGVVED